MNRNLRIRTIILIVIFLISGELLSQPDKITTNEILVKIIQQGDNRKLNKLLASRARIKQYDNKGRSLLFHAINTGNVNTLNILLKSGHVDVDLVSGPTSVTPLLQLLSYRFDSIDSYDNDLKILDLILQSGADVMLPGSLEGQNAVSAAILSKNYDALEQIINSPTYDNSHEFVEEHLPTYTLAKQATMYTPLNSLYITKDIMALDILIDAGAITVNDLVMLYNMSNKGPIIREHILSKLEYGVLKKDMSPFAFATINEDYKLIKSLLHSGFDINATNEGLSAYDYALINKKPKIAEFLKSNGGKKVNERIVDRVLYAREELAKNLQSLKQFNNEFSIKKDFTLDDDKNILDFLYINNFDHIISNKNDQRKYIDLLTDRISLLSLEKRQITVVVYPHVNHKTFKIVLEKMNNAFLLCKKRNFLELDVNIYFKDKNMKKFYLGMNQYKNIFA